MTSRCLGALMTARPPHRLLLNPPNIPPTELDSDSDGPSGATDVTGALIPKCFITNLSALTSYCIRLDKSRSTLFRPAGKFIFSTKSAAATRTWQKVIKHPNINTAWNIKLITASLLCSCKTSQTHQRSNWCSPYEENTDFLSPRSWL